MSAPDTSSPAPDPIHPTWSERNYRALKVAVIGMAVLIVVGLIVIFFTIVNRVAGSGSASEEQPVTIAMPPDIAGILGSDGEVVSTAVDGSRMAIVFRRPEGHAVLVVDLRTGRVLNVITGDAAEE